MNRWQVMGWWELRRVPFTIVVWLVTSACIVVADYFDALNDYLAAVGLLLSYIIVLNIAYTWAWARQLDAHAKAAAPMARSVLTTHFRHLLRTACLFPTGACALMLAYRLFDVAFAP